MIKKIFLIIFPILLLVSCSARQGASVQNENAGDLLNQLSKAVQQQSFRFDGSQSYERDHLKGENILSFSGHVQKNRDTYIRLQIPPEHNGMAEEMGIYAKGNSVYMRFADEVAWKQVDGQNAVIDGEIKRWNPAYHFQRILQMPNQIQTVRGDQPTIRVILDPKSLREDYLAAIRSRIEDSKSGVAGIAGVDGISLSGEDQDLFIEQLSSLKSSMKERYREMEDSFSIRGEYLISYDPKEKVPTKLEYIQEIEYMEEGELQHEVAETEIYLREFGQEGDLPDTIGIE